MPSYAHRAKRSEIEQNEFNLNIPRYVDTYEVEKEIDIGALQEEIRTLEEQLSAVRNEMNTYFKELGYGA